MSRWPTIEPTRWLVEVRWLWLGVFFAFALRAYAGERRVDGPKVEWPRGLVVVVDSGTAGASEREIGVWRGALEKDGWATWLVSDSWVRCEDVRSVLRGLVKEEPRIEGAVFVGEVPLARVRGADHLLGRRTRAGLDEGLEREIVSDAMFGDFDLVFEALDVEVDSNGEQRFELSADSPQIVERELFVARVRPVGEAEARRTKLARFLEKSARGHGTRRALVHATTLFGGEVQRNFESWILWGNEVFSGLREPGRSFRNVDLAGGDELRARLGVELVELPVDLVLFRRAQLDSSEFDFACGLESRAPVIVFDRCGLDPRRANAFVGGSNAVVAILGGIEEREEVQLGLLRLGDTVGSQQRRSALLEAAVFGDPTFAFDSGGLAAARDVGFDRTVVDDETLEGLLEPAAPASLRARAIEIGARRGGDGFRARLVRFVKTDPSAIVRYVALGELARSRSLELESVLAAAIADPAAEVRAAGATLMGEIGRREDLKRLLCACTTDASGMVVEAARSALANYDVTLLSIAVDEYVTVSAALAEDPQALRRLNELVSRCRSLHEPIAAAGVTDSRGVALLKSRIHSFQRNHVHAAPPVLLDLAAEEKAAALVRVAAIEALGWFQYSRSRPDVVQRLRSLAADDSVPAEIRREARKSARRLEDGPNSPLAP